MIFNLNRLSIARKRRQLTKKDLAERAGISQVTLTRIETGGTREPEKETVEALAKALSYPTDFFYGDDCEELQAEEVSFRSLSSMTSRQRSAALSSGAIGHMLNQWVSDRFNLPSADFPDLRDEEPESAAAALRRYWGIGFKPIPHLMKLLEVKGVRVFTLAEGKDVDAFSYWKDGIPFVFLNTVKSAERSRFDAAHELGHLVLHRHGSTQGRKAEQDADKFASHFLIPRDDLTANLPHVLSLNQLICSKERWGVSVSALARTVFDENLISDWHYRELCKQISRRGFRTSEPNSRQKESSILWHKILESLWRERITKESIAAELNLPMDEIESLLCGVLGTTSETTPMKAGKPSLSVVPNS